MSHGIWPKAMMIMLCGAVLLSLAPATACAIDSTALVRPRSQTAVLEVPGDGAGREGSETQDMPIALFISGVICGLLLGLLLGFPLRRAWRERHERQHAIDQLTAQFQALFREIDAGKNPFP